MSKVFVHLPHYSLHGPFPVKLKISALALSMGAFFGISAQNLTTNFGAAAIAPAANLGSQPLGQSGADSAPLQKQSFTKTKDWNTLQAQRDSSAFEKLVAQLGYSVPVYGAEFFAHPERFEMQPQVQVADDYLLGPGDQVDVRIWGSVSYQQKSVVDRSGQIYIPQVGSVNVAGVRFRDLRAHLSQAVAKMYRNFELSASLGQLRGVQVYLTGEALRPGAYVLGGTSTLVNALLASGGPAADGSLREIELRRGGRTVGKLDLYDLLARGDKSGDLGLSNGDVIYIPPAQSQIALMGVRHPGIYEIQKGETLEQMVALAGGLDLSADQGLIRVERMVRDSGLRVQQYDYRSAGRSLSLSGGELIRFNSAVEKFDGAVSLRGQVQNPGRFPWHAGMKVSDLIPSVQTLLTRDYFRHQNSQLAQSGGSFRRSDSLLGINWEYAVVERFNADSLRTQLIPFELGKAVLEHDPKQDLELKSGDVVTVFNTTDVSVPVGKRPIYVSIEGEVNKVGTYRVGPGEKLRDVIARAGGLTADAYVFGTKFLRISAAQMQQVSYEKVIAEMEKQFESNAAQQQASASGPEAAKAVQEQINSQRKWFETLKKFKPEGRLVMEMDADLDLRAADMPNVNLEDGDRVIIPARPSVVSVFGEVPMQNAFFYHKGNDIGDYVDRAGGATQYADQGGTFVIRADGSVKSERETGWFIFGNLSGRDAMPGDAIFVPKDLDYSRWMADLKDWAQVLSDFGLGAAAIVTLYKGVK